MRAFTMRLPTILILLCICWDSSLGTTTEKFEAFTPDYANQNQNVDAPVRGITDLVLQQTEAIKKIIADQQLSNYPLESIKQIQDTMKNEPHTLDELTEIKKKCEYLSKLANMQLPLPNNPEMFKTEEENPRNGNDFVYNPADILAFKPPTNLPMPSRQQPQMTGNYFLFTQNPEMYGNSHKFTDKMDTAASSVEEDIATAPVSEEDDQQDADEDYENETSTRKPEEIPSTISTTLSTTPVPTVSVSTMSSTTKTMTAWNNANLPLPKFKYVRLEPIVLKQIALPNGRFTRQWYRILPATQSFVQIADSPENQEIDVVAQPQNYDHSVLIPNQYKLYVDPQSGLIKSNLQSHASALSAAIDIPTSTTEKPQQPQFFINPQTGMIYQSALPNQFIYHNRDKITPVPPPVTTTTTTTSTTTTEKIPDLTYTIDIPHKPQTEEEKPKPTEAKKQFKHEFRFVIPMVVQGTQEEVSKYPYQIDPYAYLPSAQRPELMNIPVPYVPNYQMIRKLMMPNSQKVNED